jgi:hypothetical protein
MKFGDKFINSCGTLISFYKKTIPSTKKKEMTEDILHFVWKHNTAMFNSLKTSNNERIEIISAGEYNFDSGPDFFNAKIKIGQTVWAGNVEVHVNSSDWNRHGHCKDPAYDSVILHAVAKNDAIVYNSKGDTIQTVEIPYPSELEWDLQRLVANEEWIPCANHLKSFGEFNLKMWLSALAIERLEQKTIYVNDLVNQLKGSWEEAFYISVARSFGLKINALPFELLAKSTPLKVLAKSKNNLLTLEAILFGQAGMLEYGERPTDEYMQILAKEYQYQQKKNALLPIPNHLWKFMRLRPISFPTIRIAQFAELIHKSTGLFAAIMESNDYEKVCNLLRVGCSDYWMNHYTFGNESKSTKKVLGEDAIRVIVLNSVIPFMFAFGAYKANSDLKDKAINLLESIKPENNKVVNGFAQYGVTADSAFFSQAMVQLKSNYCDRRKCLYCQIGANVLLKRIG